MLEDRDFIRRRPGSSLGGETEYAFKHALTREVVYGSVPKARRARLHADFAAWLERTGGGRDEDAALLAHHYAQAARPEDADLAWADDAGRARRACAPRAVRWLRRAAELAISRYDLDEGIADLQRALELCEPHERSELWREIGRASALKFDGERFWEAMKRALKLTDDPEEQADILGQPRRPDRDSLRHVAAPARARRGGGLDRPGASSLRSRAARRTSRRSSRARTGIRPRSMLLPRKASALAEQSGDLVLRSYAWGARASAAFAERDYEESFDVGAAAARPDAADRRSRPPHRDLRGA